MSEPTVGQVWEARKRYQNGTAEQVCVVTEPYGRVWSVDVTWIVDPRFPERVGQTGFKPVKTLMEKWRLIEEVPGE